MTIIHIAQLYNLIYLVQIKSAGYCILKKYVYPVLFICQYAVVPLLTLNYPLERLTHACRSKGLSL